MDVKYNLTNTNTSMYPVYLVLITIKVKSEEKTFFALCTCVKVSICLQGHSLLHGVLIQRNRPISYFYESDWLTKVGV